MKKKSISYAKWGYIFLIPFFVVYCIFALVPLVQTFYYSFIEYYVDTGTVSIFNPDGNIVDNGFCGFANFKEAVTGKGHFFSCLGNTVILWLIGFIPQIFFSLLLAVWFTDIRLKLKAQGFFKTVIYLPNIVMASALGLLFYSLFINNGPLDSVLGGLTDKPSLMDTIWGARGIAGFINFMMWYGNTTILLMAAIMGIDTSLYESAQIDGATPTQTFWKITIPLIKPILAFVLITSMIGGLQMFDVPTFIAGDAGYPQGKMQTLVMVIQTGKDSSVGLVGAISVMIFIITAILGFLTLKVMNDDGSGKKKKKKPAKG